MQDIADSLGISKCMVSMALSDKYGVSEDTRAQVLSAAIRMRYDFSKVRRNHRQGTRVVTVLVQERDLFSKRYWPQVFKGVIKRIKSLDYHFYTEILTAKTDRDKLLMHISEHCTDGIIVLNYLRNSLLMHLNRLSLPIVMIDSRDINGSAFDQVRVNNISGSFEAAKLLVEKGHRSVCFVGNKDYSVSFGERYTGFRDAATIFREKISVCEITGAGTPAGNARVFDRLGIDTESLMLEENLFDAAALWRQLGEKQRQATAFICANDIVANALRAIAEKLGLRIPEDLSVVGFDNIAIYNNPWITEELTSVTVPTQQLGERAIELLNRRLEDPGRLCETILLAANVVNKHSVRNLTE